MAQIVMKSQTDHPPDEGHVVKRQRLSLEMSGSSTASLLSSPSVTSCVSQPTLPTMPTAILLNILQYVDGDSDKRYHPDILAFERTCRSFHHLLKKDTIWGTLFPNECRGRKHFDHPPTMRDKTFLCASLRGIRKYQKNSYRVNILLRYLGGAVGVRRIVGLLLDAMNPLRVRPPLFLRGDAIEYLVEVIQGHTIARLQKVLLLVIRNLRPGDGYPEVTEKDFCLLDELTLYDDSFRHPSYLGELNCNALEHCRCSIANNKHSCKRMASLYGEVWWTWPDHNCASEEILGAEDRRKMVRALAYRAGIVKMSGSAFSIVATEVLHHMAVIVSYAYDTFVSDPPAMQLEESHESNDDSESDSDSDSEFDSDSDSDSDQSEEIHLDVRGNTGGLNYYTFEDGDDTNADYDSDQSETIQLDVRGKRSLNYFAEFHPPGQTDLVVIPRQIRDAAVMIGMKPLLGFGVFGAEWASSNDDETDESSNDDETDEEVENAENQYYPAEEIESDDGRVGGDEQAIVPAPGFLANCLSLIPNWMIYSFYRH